jgi:hypothetical protein
LIGAAWRQRQPSDAWQGKRAFFSSLLLAEFVCSIYKLGFCQSFDEGRKCSGIPGHVVHFNRPCGNGSKNRREHLLDGFNWEISEHVPGTGYRVAAPGWIGINHA